jgi:hypothetical protein
VPGRGLYRSRRSTAYDPFRVRRLVFALMWLPDAAFLGKGAWLVLAGHQVVGIGLILSLSVGYGVVTVAILFARRRFASRIAKPS